VGAQVAAGGPIITPEQKAQLIKDAQALVMRRRPRADRAVPVALRVHEQLQLQHDGDWPPWSEMTAYDLNTGDIKWRVPTGSTLAPAELGIPANSGSHFPRAAPLVTAGGLVFFATGSDRRFRAYDRDNGKEVWSMELPAASEGWRPPTR
jgi:hypothetical protein